MNKESLISIVAFLLVTFGAVAAQPDKAVPSARTYSSIAQAEAHVPAIVIKNSTTDLPLVVQVQPTPEEEQRNNLDKRTSPGGHLKMPHPRPGQNASPGSGGTRDDYAI